MPLVFYQVLHVISLLALSAFAYGIICSDHNKTLKKLYGLASFFVLLGGFGLIARLGYNFKDNPWLTVKLIVWFALSAGIPILVKRTNLSRFKLGVLILLLLFIAVFMVYVRPF